MRPGTTQHNEAWLVIAHLQMAADRRVRHDRSHDLLCFLQGRNCRQVSARSHGREILLHAIRREPGKHMTILELDRRSVLPVHEKQVKNIGALFDMQCFCDFASRIVVAIPAFIAYKYLLGRSEEFVNNLEEEGRRIIEEMTVNKQKNSEDDLL